jgi:hypothetical protein
MYHSTSRIPCLSCDSTRLTIPVSENLVGIVERLLDRGIEVVSSSCDVHDAHIDGVKGKVCTGKTVQLQIELGYPYPIEMFYGLAPGWLTYEYHTVQEHSQIGPKYLGLSHSEDFIPLDEAELEFQTALTIKNLECYLDDKDPDSFVAVWTLAGYPVGR